MKLWQKGIDVDKQVEDYTVGKDHLLDQRLVPYDCRASIAHARMLAKIGILSKKELHDLEVGLTGILSLHGQGDFTITKEDEDCHTAIERHLTDSYGETGKKIHTARSRNDQVLIAIRLYEKDALDTISSRMTSLQEALAKLVAAYGNTPIPGYTHMQKAMPTTIGCWLGSYILSLEDTKGLLPGIFSMVDQSPLGTAAGFGVPILKIDREMTAKELGFSRVQENPMHAQLSRGKTEGAITHLCSQASLDCNRLATDLILFSTPEFGYLRLPEKFCTGSSIMPQKKNPDVLELARANYHVVLGEQAKIQGIIGNLMSGYNRDLQLTKEPLFNAIDMTLSTLSIMSLVVSGLVIDHEACKKAMTKELYATEEAYKLVKKGMPFREAYREIARRM